jgi:hypothetical protein
VAERVRELCSMAGFEVRQQVQLAAVVEPVVRSTEGDTALRLVAATKRPRHEMRGVDRLLATHEAHLAGDLRSLRL